MLVSCFDLPSIRECVGIYRKNPLEVPSPEVLVPIGCAIFSLKNLVIVRPKIPPPPLRRFTKYNERSDSCRNIQAPIRNASNSMVPPRHQPFLDGMPFERGRNAVIPITLGFLRFLHSRPINPEEKPRCEYQLRKHPPAPPPSRAWHTASCVPGVPPKLGKIQRSRAC
jgi:hypothetical protein